MSLESIRLFAASLKELDNYNMTDKTQQTPYPIRMSPELRERLERAAKNSGRSLHAEIIKRLETSDPAIVVTIEANNIDGAIADLEKTLAKFKHMKDSKK